MRPPAAPMRCGSAAALWLTLALAAGPAHAQTDTTSSTPAAKDSAAAQRATARRSRASWTSDRVTLRAGDLLTVVVDEQTAARERVSRVAVGNRQQRADLRTHMGATQNQYAFGTGMNTDSRDVGEANRIGDLTAVLSVRVDSLTENGLAAISGSKKVTVDGRLQEITLKGVIRPQDVSGSNEILSSRVADVVITYKGKTIGPRMGIIGKILGMLWP